MKKSKGALGCKLFNKKNIGSNMERQLSENEMGQNMWQTCSKKQVHQRSDSLYQYILHIYVQSGSTSRTRHFYCHKEVYKS